MFGYRRRSCDSKCGVNARASYIFVCVAGSVGGFAVLGFGLLLFLSVMFSRYAIPQRMENRCCVVGFV